jgi:hypothetical protein
LPIVHFAQAYQNNDKKETKISRSEMKPFSAGSSALEHHEILRGASHRQSEGA